MRAYVIRRLLLIIPTLFILSILVFLSVRFIPGDVIDVMAGQLQSTTGIDIDRAALERRLGLDVPVWVQYGRWIGEILRHGALGESLMGDWSVEDKILGRLPVTIQLGAMAIVIGLVIALPVGIYSAIRQDTAVDYVGRSSRHHRSGNAELLAGTYGDDLPGNLVGLVATDENGFLSRKTRWGISGCYFIPSLILGTASAAATMRMTRTMMLEVLRQDYIRTAWSKGLKERVVIMRHAVKNALIPIVTLIGLQLPMLVGGAVIMENIFNLPGIGRLLLDALQVTETTRWSPE